MLFYLEIYFPLLCKQKKNGIVSVFVVVLRNSYRTDSDVLIQITPNSGLRNTQKSKQNRPNQS